MDVQPEATEPLQGCVGVDLGVKTLATLSQGPPVPAVKPYRKAKKRLARLQRSVSRKQKGSKNRVKAIKRLAQVHYRVACIRADATHKLTSRLAKNQGEVVIEDLNVSGMLKNHRLAQAIADGGFYEFRRQLEYKCEWYGSKLKVVDRFYPSSKMCSSCGHVHLVSGEIMRLLPTRKHETVAEYIADCFKAEVKRLNLDDWVSGRIVVGTKTADGREQGRHPDVSVVGKNRMGKLSHRLFGLA